MRLLNQVSHHLRPAAAVPDARANAGHHTLVFVLICRAGSVVAAGPQRTAFAALDRATRR